MKNLKKLIYQYNFLKLDLDDIKEQHSILASEFETLFSDIIPKNEPNEEDIVKEALDSEAKKKSVKLPISDSTKKIYKDVAKKLHPDAGGDDVEFKELNSRYKKNDLLGVISLAVENDVNIKLSDDDTEQIQQSIDELINQIEHYKTTLAYVWEYGSVSDRKNVINTLSKHFNKKIDISELNDSIKKKLGIE